MAVIFLVPSHIDENTSVVLSHMSEKACLVFSHHLSPNNQSITPPTQELTAFAKLDTLSPNAETMLASSSTPG